MQATANNAWQFATTTLKTVTIVATAASEFSATLGGVVPIFAGRAVGTITGMVFGTIKCGCDTLTGGNQYNDLSQYIIRYARNFTDRAVTSLNTPLFRNRKIYSIAGLCGMAGTILITHFLVTPYLGLSSLAARAAVQIVHIPYITYQDVVNARPCAQKPRSL